MRGFFPFARFANRRPSHCPKSQKTDNCRKPTHNIQYSPIHGKPYTHVLIMHETYVYSNPRQGHKYTYRGHLRCHLVFCDFCKVAKFTVWKDKRQVNALFLKSLHPPTYYPFRAFCRMDTKCKINENILNHHTDTVFFVFLILYMYIRLY